jgi:Fe-S-cluster containining protein
MSGRAPIPFQEEATMTAIRPTLCARCARQGKTCCQGREIYLTPGDLQRICRFTRDLEFMEWSASTDPSYLDQDDDPVWQRHVFGRDGRRRILQRRANGDCYFLDFGGCRLPMEVRPLLCRLHPVTYTADHIDGEADEGCPRHLLYADESVFGALHMTMDLARQWHRQLYEEIMTDEHDDRIDLRPPL